MAGLRVAIAGDGIIGWSVAFELAQRGASVVVYAPGCAGAATHASAGILAPYTEAQDASGLLSLGKRGLCAYDDFVRRVAHVSNMAFEYRRTGTLEVADDEARARDLHGRVRAEWASEAQLEWVASPQLQVDFPYLSPAAVGGLKCGVHGFVAVQPFVAATAQAARVSGVRVEARAVEGVQPCHHGIAVSSAAGSREFDYVVLCAGAWTPSLDARIQGVKPVRGQLVKLASDAVRPGRVLWGRDCYIVPWDDGTVLVGATVEDVGFDVRATADGVRGLLEAAQRLVPALASATFVEVRVGLRPASASGLPLLGPGADPRVVYATGHFRNGVLLAPLTARLITDYVLESALDPAFSAA
jgi:glycine oxidase